MCWTIRTWWFGWKYELKIKIDLSKVKSGFCFANRKLRKNPEKTEIEMRSWAKKWKRCRKKTKQVNISQFPRISAIFPLTSQNAGRKLPYFVVSDSNSAWKLPDLGTDCTWHTSEFFFYISICDSHKIHLLHLSSNCLHLLSTVLCNFYWYDFEIEMKLIKEWLRIASQATKKEPFPLTI